MRRLTLLMVEKVRSAGLSTGGLTVSILVRYRATGLTAETYDESTRQLAEAGVERRPEGLELHVCFGTDGDLQVTEIWESREKFSAFGERLRQMPVLRQLGIEYSSPPEIFDV